MFNSTLSNVRHIHQNKAKGSCPETDLKTKTPDSIKTHRGAFRIPNQVSLIRKHIHKTQPTSLPHPTSGSDEVRWFIYQVLTLKNYRIAKDYPGFLYQTVARWHGSGADFRALKEDQYRELCVYSIVYADGKGESASPKCRTLIGQALWDNISRLEKKERDEQHIENLNRKAEKSQRDSRWDALARENRLFMQGHQQLQPSRMMYRSQRAAANDSAPDLSIRTPANAMHKDAKEMARYLFRSGVDPRHFTMMEQQQELRPSAMHYYSAQQNQLRQESMRTYEHERSVAARRLKSESHFRFSSTQPSLSAPANSKIINAIQQQHSATSERQNIRRGRRNTTSSIYRSSSLISSSSSSQRNGKPRVRFHDVRGKSQTPKKENIQSQGKLRRRNSFEPSQTQGMLKNGKSYGKIGPPFAHADHEQQPCDCPYQHQHIRPLAHERSVDKQKRPQAQL
ncbi:hypothetical protein AOQ84DRAFT_223784 [Glonium stellatum]|uniref:Uncharacterized protein n=1 Tax=Glonium stellatum TaxID=574774 RepID=A0A8E2FB60_9PEZI|nr:hypothetical protein AOQ84DRAFT_223784 [Glonium stellatum]